MKPSSHEGEDGFSLPELLLVVALIGITSGIAFYSASSGPGRSSAAASRIAQQLEMARARALFDQNDFVITFDTNTGVYSILDDNNSDGNFDSAIGETVKTVSVSEGGTDVVFGAPLGLRGINGEGVTTPVTFSGGVLRFGARSSAVSGTIYLIPREDAATSTVGHMRAISVSASTGRVKRWRYDADSNGPGPWRLER